jgi:nucleotide-binding universal stress UspA family protein
MRVLIATTPNADRESYRVAAELAHAVDGTLVIASVIRAIGPELAADAQRDLDAIRNAIADIRVDVRTEVLFGERDEAICDYVAARKVDLVVLHDDSERDDLLMQSVGCPVMVLGSDCDGMRLGLSGERRLSVVVAIDRSEASDAPVAWIKRLRSRVPCDVTLLYAYWPTAEHDRLGVPLPGELLHANPQVVATLVRELEHRVGTLMGEGMMTIHCRPAIAMVDEVVNGFARRIRADMVVVGSHRRRGWDRFAHPSVSEALASSAELPIVCVQHEMFTSDARPQVRRVLAATDFTAAGNHAIEAAIDLIGNNVATLALVHVRSHNSPKLNDADLAKRLRDLVPATNEAVTTQTFVLDDGPVATAILHQAAQWNADAICLGARTPGMVSRVIRDSVAGEVVKRAECPVLVARGRPN